MASHLSALPTGPSALIFVVGIPVLIVVGSAVIALLLFKSMSGSHSGH